jgi:hypothetical protein
MSEMGTGVGAEADILKSDDVRLRVVFFMMRSNSLTKVIKQQYNTK